MPNLPITSPDTGPGHPIDGKTSHNDGPKGPFFITDRLPVSHLDQDALLSSAGQYGDGKTIVLYFLEKAGVITAEPKPDNDTKSDKAEQNPVTALVGLATNFYEDAFFADFEDDRKGLDGDGLMDLYEATEGFEKQPFLEFFRELSDANPNTEAVRDAERIARILVLDEAQRTQ